MMKGALVFVFAFLVLSGFTNYSEISRPQRKGRVPKEGLNTKADILHVSLKAVEVPDPWTAAQLMAPADLAAIMNDPKQKQPVIICVGPGALIRASLDIGPANEKENLEKLKQELRKLPRDTNVVIYCGCCPFEHCPNIRPAFSLLNEMKFTNAHLLN